MNNPIDGLRRQLDAIDDRLLAELSARLGTVREIARLKETETSAVRDPSREADLLSRLAQKAESSGLNPNFVERLFRQIIENSVRHQQRRVLSGGETGGENPIAIAYQGGPGAYSHLAALHHTETQPGPVECVGCQTFADAVESVRLGQVDLAILPVENSIAGAISEVLDLLVHSGISIVGEETLHVRHCLIGLPDSRIEQLREVFSHPVALGQCRRFLSTHPHWKVTPHVDTALAVAEIARSDNPAHAAIASCEAADRYGLEVLERDIADTPDHNVTRFAVIAREALEAPSTVACKTSLMFSVANQTGSLTDCLQEFSSRSINLTRLESRPRPGIPGEYLFYVDAEGRQADDALGEALSALERRTTWMRVMGSYPTVAR